MSNNNITNERMTAFNETIVGQVRELLSEREDDILKSWHENIEEAQENEKNFPPLKLSIAVTIDLEGNAIETAVSFTTKYTSRLQSRLPDPDQPELPMEGLRKALQPGDSVSIEIDGKQIAKFEKPKAEKPKG